MKTNIFKKVALAISLVAAAGCDIEPVYFTQVAPDTFYESKEAVWQRFYRPFTHARYTFAMNSDFFAVQELTTDEFISPVRGSQNADKSNIFYKMHYHDFPLYFSASYFVYNNRMLGISRCWATLDDLSQVNLKKFGFPDGTFDNWKAQMEAMVGIYYLEGLDCYGGLPLYPGSAKEEKPRSTAKETFYFIEDLLKKSIKGLEAKKAGETEQGDIRQAAAAMALARLYFNAVSYIGVDMYDEAAKVCEDLIAGKYGAYELDADWTTTFGFNNENSKEIIWSIPNEGSQLETDAYELWTRQMPTNMRNYLGGLTKSAGNNYYCLTPSLDGTGKPYTYKLGSPFSKFEDTDVRKKPYRYLGNGKYEGMFFFGELVNPDNPSWKVTGTQEYYGKTLNLVDQVAQLSKGKTESNMNTGEENSGIRIIKYCPRPNSNDARLLFNPDIPLMRLSEAYYTLAECKMRKGDKAGAAKLINEVRKRYFEGGNDPNPVTAENLDQWRMLDEWMVEFLGECRRRTDLIRWNQYITGEWWDHQPDGGVNSYKKLFPFSAEHLRISKVLEQNPGYEGL